MEKKRAGWYALLTLVVALGGGAGGCDDSESNENSADDGADGDGVDDGLDGDGDAPDEAKTIVETAVAAGGFETLVGALAATGLDDALSGEGPFTVFAPTDEAFAKLDEGLLESLSEEQLAEILKYHVVAGAVLSGDLEAKPVATLSGFSAFVDLSSGVKVNNATVQTADIGASNGVIHVIDTVLLPPNLAQAAEYAGFTELLGAVEAAELTPALTNPDAELTVFAPTNEAFEQLAETVDVGSLSKETLADIITYHVVNGTVLAADLKEGEVTMLNGDDVDVTLQGGAKVNGSNVLLTDIVTTNGVIHVIDGVLVPAE